MASKKSKAGAESRRQKKLERNRRKDRQRKLKAKRREANATEAEKAVDVDSLAASSAFGMPVLFRSLKINNLRSRGADFDLKDMEIELTWYQSQEARQAGQNEETIACLKIEDWKEIPVEDSPCAKIWIGLSEMRVLRINAVLVENVDRDAAYGKWLQRQEQKGISEDDGFVSETPICFDTVIARVPKAIRGLIESRLQILTPVRFVPGCLNVVDNGVVGNEADTMSDLQLDRWFELDAMLRIHMPHIILPRPLPEPERFTLKQRLSRIEAEELEAAEHLRPASEASIAAWQKLEGLKRRKQLIEEESARRLLTAEEALRNARQAVQRAESEVSRLSGVWRTAQKNVFEAVGTEPAELKRRQERAEYSKGQFDRAPQTVVAAARKMRSAEKTRDRVNAEEKSILAQIENEIQSAEELFFEAKEREAPLSKRFEFAFYRRQEVLAKLST